MSVSPFELAIRRSDVSGSLSQQNSHDSVSVLAPRRAGWRRIGARRSPTAARFDGRATPHRNVDVVFRFASDSPLEGDGFEPSVPGAKEPVFVAESDAGDRTRSAKRSGLAAGGNEIRTVGTAVKERPFRRTPYGYFSRESTGTSGLSPMTTGTKKA
jgi:hypothetical protein